MALKIQTVFILLIEIESPDESTIYVNTFLLPESTDRPLESGNSPKAAIVKGC